eukprot:s2235_g10.t1
MFDYPKLALPILFSIESEVFHCNGFVDMAPRRPKGNVRLRESQTPRPQLPHRHPDLPVLASDSFAAGNVCVRKYLEEGRDWRKLTPQEVIRHFMACNLPAVSLRRPKRELSGPLIAAAAPPASRRQGLLAAVATGILQAVDQGFYWSSDQKCEGVRIPMSRLVRLPAVKTSREVHHGGAVCTVSDSLAVDVCLAHAAEEDQRKVALVRITSNWAFTVKHLEMDPLWLRSSYLKALFEMERQIHSPLSTLEEDVAVYTSDVSFLRGPLEEGAPWLPKAHRMDVIWLNLQRNPDISEKDHYLKEVSDSFMKFEVSLPSGRRETVAVSEIGTVADLKTAAQESLGRRFLRLAAPDGRLFDPTESLRLSGFQDGESLTAVAQQPKLAATMFAFALWCTGADRVVTWGDQHKGGDSSRVQHQLKNVQQICGRFEAFAAILADGSVVTWGNPGWNSSRVQHQLRNVQQICCSYSAFAAILADGSVVTWGNPVCGGDSSRVQHQLKNVQQICGTFGAFAAILADGSVVTWGNPDCGGDSSRVQHQLRNVQQICCSYSAFAAILADGSVVTWGNPGYGGDSSKVLHQLKNVQQICGAYGAFAAILADGSVVTWGNPDYGGDSSRVQHQLQQICGTNGAFAAILADGSVVTWGNPVCGGDSSRVQHQLKNVQQICGTKGAFAAILADGSVVTWGNADCGGDSSRVQHQLKNVQQICGAYRAFAAILADGSVVTWGNPDYGGDSSREERLRVMEKFQQLMSLAEQQGVSVLVLPPPRDVWHPSAALGEVLRDAARNTGLQQVIVCKEMPEKFYGRWNDFTDAFRYGIQEVVYDKDLEDRQAVVARLHLKSRSSLEAELDGGCNAKDVFAFGGDYVYSQRLALGSWLEKEYYADYSTYWPSTSQFGAERGFPTWPAPPAPTPSCGPQARALRQADGPAETPEVDVSHRGGWCTSCRRSVPPSGKAVRAHAADLLLRGSHKPSQTLEPLVQTLAKVLDRRGLAHACKGPAGCLKFYFSRIDWTLDAAGNVMVAPFRTYLFLTISQKTWRKLLQDAWQEDLLLRFTAKKGLRGLPPISKLDTAAILKKITGMEQKALMNEIAAAFQCGTQQAAWDPRTDSNCPHCGLPDTKYHRISQCDFTADLRTEIQPTITWMQTEGVEWHELPVIHTLQDQEWHSVYHLQQIDPQVPEPLYTTLHKMDMVGHILHFYTDGSCQYPAFPTCRFASFAVVLDVCTSDQERIGAANLFAETDHMPACFFPLTVAHTQGEQCIHRAELYAIVWICERFYNVEIHTDSTVALAATRAAHMDLSLLHHMDNLDLILRLKQVLFLLGNRQFCKVQAHSEQAADSSWKTLFHRIGNKRATDAAIAANQFLQPDAVRDFQAKFL